jgi:hypothetical protein
MAVPAGYVEPCSNLSIAEIQHKRDDPMDCNLCRSTLEVSLFPIARVSLVSPIPMRFGVFVFFNTIEKVDRNVEEDVRPTGRKNESYR